MYFIKTIRFFFLALTMFNIYFIKFPWEKFIINGIFEKLESKQKMNLSLNEFILVDDWNYIIQAVNLYNEYNTNHKRFIDKNYYGNNKFI